MKFTVNRLHLQKAISKVDSIISVREIKSTLSNILIEAKDNSVILTASDFEIVISTNLSAEVSKIGKTTLPAKNLVK